MSDSDDDDEVEYESEIFKIGNYSLNITTISQMPIHILMKNAGKGIEISGQKLWCGSLGAIEYLIDNKDFYENKIVIELGAGTGVMGMLCKKMGAKRVLLTDYDEKSINHMNYDCKMNEIDAEVKVCDWFNFDINELQLDMNNTKNIRIVAGDVLYKNIVLEPFWNTVKMLFSLSDEIQMLLCHVPRAGVEHHQVINAAITNGLSIKELDSSLWRKGCCLEYSPVDDNDRAKLYMISVQKKI
jgi:hypothetical protein